MDTMSTTEPMYTDEDIALICADLKAAPNSFWGNDEQEWAVSPFLTFYFLYDSKEWINASLEIVEIHERFERLTQHPYITATHPDSERPHPYGSKRLPDLRDFARKTKIDDHFLFKVTSGKKSALIARQCWIFLEKTRIHERSTATCGQAILFHSALLSLGMVER